MPKALSRFLAGISAGVILISFGTNQLSGQDKPKYDMGRMQMVFLKLAPEWKPAAPGHEKSIRKNQQQFEDELLRTGKCALAGAAKGKDDLQGILVFKSESIEEVRELTRSFPAVKSGMLEAEVVSWFAARNVIGTPGMPLERANYVFAVLLRGPSWTAESNEETKKLQQGHMANINRLAEMGKLVLAGPFVNGGNRSGVFIFKVATPDEALALSNTDPAVIAGRFKIEVYNWSVPKGVLP